MTSIQRRLVIAAIAMVLVISAGILGFILIEGWSFLDAAFMTVISLTTVGYGEVHPLSANGRIFAMFLILTGVGILAYGVSSVTAFVVGGELTDILEKRKMEKEISKLKGHIVLCGLGQTGRHVAEEFIKTKTQFVAIERHKETLDHRKSLGPFLYVHGDATQAESLVEANVASARGLITTLASDKDNLFVVMTAKELNPDLRIVTRLIEDESQSKLAKVGADAIVSSNHIGGMRMASEMIRPEVVSFLDIMLREKERVTRVEEAQVFAQSKLAGRTLKEGGIREKTGLLVIALRKASDQKYLYNPGGDTKIEAGDWLIVYGAISQIEKLRELASG